MAQGSASGKTYGLTYECERTGLNNTIIYGECTFDDLILATKNLINKVIPIVLGLTVITIAYAGFIYMTEGASAGGRSKANNMFKNVAIGIFFILAAWMIVNLIANVLVSPSVPRILN